MEIRQLEADALRYFFSHGRLMSHFYTLVLSNQGTDRSEFDHCGPLATDVCIFAALRLHSDSDVTRARLTQGKLANAVVYDGNESEEGPSVPIKCSRNLGDLNTL